MPSQPRQSEPALSTRLPIETNSTIFGKTRTDLSKSAREPRGIEGWLGLLAYGQLASSARYVMSFAQFGLSLRDGLSEPSAIPIWVQVALNVALIAFCIFTTVLLFTHSRHFPRMFVAQMICLILLPIGLLLTEATAASNTFNHPVVDFISIGLRDARLFIASTITAVSIPYVMRSRRVANTFIE
ncbi:DUF2569 family protein [Bradyrhizobium sp. HKCCYLS2038]